MKITMEMDCTPAELRQFMGLPDLKPMQDAVLAKMEGQMSDAVDRYSPDGLLKTWFTTMGQAPEQFAGVMQRLFQATGPKTDG